MLKKPLICLLAALLLAGLSLVPALSEAGEIVAEPVDEAVEELGEDELPFGDEENEFVIGAAEPVTETGKASREDVAIDAAHFPDGVFRECVREYDSNGDGVLSYGERASVVTVKVDSKGISSLDGIRWFSSLKELNCSGNQLTELLDISGCPKLEKLYCYDNQLSSVYISDCPKLSLLSCGNNQLTFLEIRDCDDLEYLYCYSNQLTELIFEYNYKLVTVNCFDNPLTSLSINYCPLTTLDVSGCNELTKLYCANNELTSLDVSGCNELTKLYCYNNQLTELDVSSCPKLTTLHCYSNKIPSIDLTNCSKLKKYALEKPVRESDGTVGFVEDDYDYHIHIDASTALTADGKLLYDPTTSLMNAKITVKDQVFTGRELKPAVTVKLNGKKLKKDRDYTVSYKNNKKVGTAKVTIKGKGTYEDTVSVTFAINPKPVSGLKLTAGKKQLTASWKKVAGVGGYELQYGKKKSFKGAKTATIEKGKTVSKTLKKLTKGKKYYVRIRAWQKVGSQTYYSAWSKAKSVKVK